jgi:hypothetical protein
VYLPCPYFSFAYPNPTNDILHVDLSQLGIPSSQKAQNVTHTVYLYDASGNLKQSKTVNDEAMVEFNISGLISGLYYVHVHNNVTRETKIERIVVEH